MAVTAPTIEQGSPMTDVAEAMPAEELKLLQLNLMQIRANLEESIPRDGGYKIESSGMPVAVTLPSHDQIPAATLLLVPIVSNGTGHMRLGVWFYRDSLAMTAQKPIIQVTDIDIPQNEAHNHTVVLGRNPAYLTNTPDGRARADAVLRGKTPHFLTLDTLTDDLSRAQLAVTFTGDSGLKVTNFGGEPIALLDRGQALSLQKQTRPCFERHTTLYTLPTTPAANA